MDELLSALPFRSSEGQRRLFSKITPATIASCTRLMLVLYSHGRRMGQFPQPYIIWREHCRNDLAGRPGGNLAGRRSPPGRLQTGSQPFQKPAPPPIHEKWETKVCRAITWPRRSGHVMARSCGMPAPGPRAGLVYNLFPHTPLVMQCSAVQCSAVQCSAVQCNIHRL
jgi:hypothetical protein